ncbi:MAG: O-antigen ligase C-terminal domain-containing protein [Polaromonas sp.]|nr:O-antigen ligase C-terminal domain-containing protein [Polaromonas sp.]
MQTATRTILNVVILLAATLPWLNPFAPGPSAAVVPLLFSLFCVAVLLSGYSIRSSVVPINRLLNVAVLSWLVAGIASSCIGLLQYFGATESFYPWVNRTELGQAFANLRQRNQFASLTNIGLVALLWLASSCQTDAIEARLVHWRWRGLIVLTAVLLAMGNASSSSRTGLAQLFLVCGLFWIWGGWRSSLVRSTLLLSLLGYGVAMVALPWLAKLDLSIYGMAARLTSGDEACGSRLVLWSNVLHLIAQKPWLGWGWGELDYAHYSTLYGGPRFCDILDNAHNLPLQLAVELGVPFALLVCGGLTWWITCQKPWRERDASRQMAWAVIAVILLHSMLEYPLWYGPFQMAFGFCLGLLWPTRQQSTESPKQVKDAKSLPNTVPAQSIQALAAMVLIAFTACAAWDYQRISQIYLSPELREAAYRDDTLAKIRSSWLFNDQVKFAELILTPLTPENAKWTYATGTDLLHYSPEPRVIEKVIESAVLLGRDDDALLHLTRYRAAFAEDYARWAKRNGQGNTDTKTGLPTLKN